VINYKIVQIEFMGQTQNHIIIDRGDDSFESFPVDEENPRYQQWLAEGNTTEIINNEVE
jgi:hypothetical protein